MLKYMNFSFLKALTFLLIFFFKAAIVVGQWAPQITWEKPLGGWGYEDAQSIKQTNDGGYIIAGFTDSNDGDITDGNNGENDVWIVKLDSFGNKSWDKTYGGSNGDGARSIQQTSDGGYIVAGYTMSNDGDVSDGNNGESDIWVIKLDTAGNKIWDKTYGGSNSDGARSIQQTSDGGYIVAGYTVSNNGDVSDGNNGESDIWVIKLDSVGNKAWDKTLGGSKADYAKSIQQTSDGGYVIGGSTRNPFLSSTNSVYGDISDGNNGWTDYWIVKSDTAGNKIWDKTLGGRRDDYLGTIQQTSDGGYIVAGYNNNDDGDITDGNNGDKDVWIVKLDSFGNKVWDKTYGGSEGDKAYSIQQTFDGGYIISGETMNNDGDITDGNNGGYDYWILKLDSSGNKVWDRTLGGSGWEWANSIQQTSDGGFVIAGLSYSWNGDVSQNYYGNGDFWIVKLGMDISVTVNQIEQSNTFTIYPNPATSQVVLGTDLIQPIGEVLITDMTGKIVKQFQTQKSTTEIDISTLENGIYFVKAGGISQKLVKK